LRVKPVDKKVLGVVSFLLRSRTEVGKRVFMKFAAHLLAS